MHAASQCCIEAAVVQHKTQCWLQQLQCGVDHSHRISGNSSQNTALVITSQAAAFPDIRLFHTPCFYAVPPDHTLHVPLRTTNR
jgi:hypothetical protein